MVLEACTYDCGILVVTELDCMEGYTRLQPDPNGIFAGRELRETTSCLACQQFCLLG
jgi:hypothetical protein